MDELAAWLFDEIEKTTELERISFLGEVLALDKKMDAIYLSNPEVLQVLRRVWAEKRDELIRAKDEKTCAK